VRYRYRNSPDEEYVGFIAEDVPALVAMQDRKSLSAMDIVAVLTRVAKEQKAQLTAQKAQLTTQKAEIVALQKKAGQLTELKAENAALSSRQARLEKERSDSLARMERLESRMEMLTRAMAADHVAMADGITEGRSN